MTTLKIGGPLAISCDTCHQPPGYGCVTVDRGGMNTSLPRKPHAARFKAAPPEVEGRVGDLVIVHVGSIFPDHIAQIMDLTPRIRSWHEQPARWGLVITVSRYVLRGLAPDDATTAAARAALEQEERPA